MAQGTGARIVIMRIPQTQFPNQWYPGEYLAFSRRFAIVTGISVAIVAITASSLPAQLQDETSRDEYVQNSFRTEDVVDAWEGRQAHIDSINFSWEWGQKPENLRTSFQAAWAPEPGFEQERPQNSLRLKGTRLRFETDRWFCTSKMEYSGFNAWKLLEESPGRTDPFANLFFHHSLGNDFQGALAAHFDSSVNQHRNPRRFTFSTDGNTSIEIFAKGSGNYAQATIADCRETGDTLTGIVEDLYYRPLLLMYRPFAPSLGCVHPDRCRLTGERAEFQGRECILLEETKPNGLACKYWIDPHRDFVIVRYLVSENDKTRAQLDIKYSQSAGDGWVPSGWIAILCGQLPEFNGHGWLSFDAVATVSSHQLNSPIPDMEYVPIAFPAGTFVIDRVRNEHYISLDRGRKRAVTRSEAADPEVSYRRLLAGSSNRLSEQVFTHFASGGWGWAIVVVMFSAAIILTIRLRRARSPRKASDPIL